MMTLDEIEQTNREVRETIDGARWQVTRDPDDGRFVRIEIRFQSEAMQPESLAGEAAFDRFRDFCCEVSECEDRVASDFDGLLPEEVRNLCNMKAGAIEQHGHPAFIEILGWMLALSSRCCACGECQSVMHHLTARVWPYDRPIDAQSDKRCLVELLTALGLPGEAIDTVCAAMEDANVTAPVMVAWGENLQHETLASSPHRGKLN